MDQELLDSLRNALNRKEVILFERFKNGDQGAEFEIKAIAKKEKELEAAAHFLNLYWY